MAYRRDDDLEFLRKMKSSELNELVEILKGKEGNERFTEEMTSNELFKKYYPNHKKYVNLILEELQLYGGNTFANIFRDSGVLYKKILCNVCDKMKVVYSKSQTVQLIELALLTKILSSISEEDLQNFNRKFKHKTSIFTTRKVVSYSRTALNLALKFKIIGSCKALSIFLGPAGLATMVAWSAVDMAGPNYRVTIPAVIQVAFLRQIYLKKRNAAIIRCLIYSIIIGVLYYYGFTDSFFEWIYSRWNG